MDGGNGKKAIAYNTKKGKKVGTQKRDEEKGREEKKEKKSKELCVLKP